MEISATVQTFPLVAQSSRWKMCWCISKPTSSENTFEEIFYCVKYLRAILLITYLSLYGYDCTDFTLTNMNEWIHEEREWCVISFIKRVKYCYFFLFRKHCVFQAHFCGTRDLFNGMKHKSFCISVKEKFSALSQRLDLISVSTNGSVFWLSICDIAKNQINLQTAAFIKTHLLVILSFWSHLRYCLTRLN